MRDLKDIIIEKLNKSKIRKVKSITVKNGELVRYIEARQKRNEKHNGIGIFDKLQIGPRRNPKNLFFVVAGKLAKDIIPYIDNIYELNSSGVYIYNSEEEADNSKVAGFIGKFMTDVSEMIQQMKMPKRQKQSYRLTDYIEHDFYTCEEILNSIK